MERMKNVMERMSEEERARMMERCFEFMTGKETGKDREQDEKKKEEPCCFPDMGRMAERCPGIMETFLSKAMNCFEGTGKEEKKDPGAKTEKSGCC